jgi:hypothetical protein
MGDAAKEGTSSAWEADEVPSETCSIKAAIPERETKA